MKIPNTIILILFRHIPMAQLLLLGIHRHLVKNMVKQPKELNIVSNLSLKGAIIIIIGISAGRKEGVTSSAVKAILESSDVEYEYISLSGKKINGCIGCVKCAADNICKQKDDWNEISDKLLKADAIVFGAPNYGGTINALGHAFLERMFCFRHREVFSLAGKLAVIVSVEYAREKENTVHNFIKKVFNTQMIAIVDSVSAIGYSQCYTCGFGENCGVGNVVRDHGFINEIKDEHYPPHFNDQTESVFHAHGVGKLLGSILKNRKTIS